MGLSVLAARILALTYIAAGIAAFSGKITFGQMVEEFERSPALTFVTGFIALVFGMVLVAYHNIWVMDWIVLITVVGWMSLFKGVLLMAFPQSVASFKGWYKNTKAWGFLKIALGILFGYFGFIV
jgi:predicted MFS family arabinose efflux permease